MKAPRRAPCLVHAGPSSFCSLWNVSLQLRPALPPGACPPLDNIDDDEDGNEGSTLPFGREDGGGPPSRGPRSGRRMSGLGGSGSPCPAAEAFPWAAGTVASGSRRKSASTKWATRQRRARACERYSNSALGCDATKLRKTRCETCSSTAPRSKATQVTLRLAPSKTSRSPTLSPSYSVFVCTGFSPTSPSGRYTPSSPSTTMNIPGSPESPALKSTSLGWRRTFT
mmetsp:Transcript_35824/g.101384  ORF Transcript_35824/g.101384 Transcript_35824/m.101384 type:complete len:226 (-) Transcript_35824:93-770(-)